jgi:hypothetical protein
MKMLEQFQRANDDMNRLDDSKEDKFLYLLIS